MLSPEYLECIADDIIKLYSSLECDIIKDMARRISKMNFASPTTVWQAEKMQQCGMCKEEIIKKVAEYAEVSEKEIKKLFEEAGVRSLEYDDAAYKRHGLNPIPLKQSPQMVQMIAASAKKTGRHMRNLTMTTAELGENELIGALDDAYMQVATGAMSHQEAVWRAVKTLTEKGGASVLYPSGHIDKTDVAVRRAVLTGVNQTVGMLTQMRMEEMQHDLVETSAHAGARPMHADWQGQRFSYSGKDRRYPDFVSSTGYGSGEGLMGWNCRHNFFPVWEDDPYTYTKADLEEMNARNIEYEGEKYTLYEIVQMQRKAERGIRQSKRTLAGYGEVLKADSTNTACRAAFEKESVRLKRREQKLKEMIRQTGISRSADRERAVGFDRSVSAKAVYAAKKEYNEYIKVLGKENMPKTFDLFLDMRYNNAEYWKFVKIDYTRQKQLIENPQLALPNAANATADDRKFTGYLFNPDSYDGWAKGRAFTSRLGYNADNYEELKNIILNSADKYPTRTKNSDIHGQGYEQKMILYGKKGTPANVIIGWKEKDGKTWLTSVYIKEVKKNEN